MKKEVNVFRLGIIGFVVLAVIAAICLILLTGNSPDYTELTEVRIRIMGTMMPSEDEYALVLKEGTWVASYNQNDWLEDNINEVPVDEEFVSGIVKTLKENKAHKWDDFSIRYEIQKRVARLATDGTIYSFYMRFSDGSTVEIKEYNLYPENYMSVFESFEEQFQNLINE